MKEWWARKVFCRRQCTKTTWRFRLAVGALFAVAVCFTPHHRLAGWIGQTLVCQEQVRAADAVVLDNLDMSYGLFERARTLITSGMSHRVLVPIPAFADPARSSISNEFVQIMARTARIEIEAVSVAETEPISLNVAYQMRDFLEASRIASVILVTPGFRSRRAELVYGSVFRAKGIAVSCVPVFGEMTADNWVDTWHGLQDLGLQFVKLQYYRFWVLPRFRFHFSLELSSPSLDRRDNPGPM